MFLPLITEKRSGVIDVNNPLVERLNSMIKEESIDDSSEGLGKNKKTKVVEIAEK